jgi:hypothetical protein
VLTLYSNVDGSGNQRALNRTHEALNEEMECDPATAAIEPCLLSVNLLTRLRELLRSSFEKMAGARKADGFLRVRPTYCMLWASASIIILCLVDSVNARCVR